MSGRAATKAIIKGDYALSVGPADMDPPRHWIQTSLLDIAQLESGHTPSRRHPEWWGGDVPWISIPDAREHHGVVIHETKSTTNDDGLANSAARLLPKDTVCLSRTASVGYVTVMGRPMATSQDFVNWICTDALDPHWLKHLFIAEERALKNEFGKGSTHTTIYFPEVKAFHVCLPPRGEQRRIVAKIDALQARSRRAREALEAIPALLDRFRQSVLAAAFRGDLTAQWRAAHPNVEPASVLLERIRAERKARWIDAQAEKARARAEAKATKAGKPWTAKDDAAALKRERAKAAKKYTEPEPVDPVKEGLPELPAGWCWTHPDEFVADSPHALAIGPFGSNLKVSDYRPDGVPLVFVRQIRAESFSGDMRYVSSAKAAELSAHRVIPGDLLMTKMGEPPGDTAVYPDFCKEAIVTADVIKLSPDERLVSSGFLYYWYRTPQLRDAILGQTKGVAQRKLSLKRFRRLPVPLPPLSEQERISEEIWERFSCIRTVAALLPGLLEQTQQLDQAVLASAFRGELVPQDPNDEPASELLKRIQAERAAAEAAKPKRGRKKKTAKKKAAKKRATKKKS